jgi:hypothetical protein
VKNRLEVAGGSARVECYGKEMVLCITLPTRQDAMALTHAVIERLESREEFSLVLQTADMPHG